MRNGWSTPDSNTPLIDSARIVGRSSYAASTSTTAPHIATTLPTIDLPVEKARVKLTLSASTTAIPANCPLLGTTSHVSFSVLQIAHSMCEYQLKLFEQTTRYDSERVRVQMPELKLPFYELVKCLPDAFSGYQRGEYFFRNFGV